MPGLQLRQPTDAGDGVTAGIHSHEEEKWEELKDADSSRVAQELSKQLTKDLGIKLKPRGESEGSAKRTRRAYSDPIDDLVTTMERTSITPSLVELPTLSWPEEDGQVAIVCIASTFAAAYSFETDTLILRPVYTDALPIEISGYMKVVLNRSHGYDINDLPLFSWYLNEKLDTAPIRYQWFAALNKYGQLQVWDVTSGTLELDLAVPSIPGNMDSFVASANAFTVGADCVVIATAPTESTTCLHVLEWDPDVVVPRQMCKDWDSISCDHTCIQSSISGVCSVEINNNATVMLSTHIGPCCVDLDIPVPCRAIVPWMSWYCAVGGLDGTTLSAKNELLVTEYEQDVHTVKHAARDEREGAIYRCIRAADALSMAVFPCLNERTWAHTIRVDDVPDVLSMTTQMVWWSNTDCGSIIPIPVKSGVTARCVDDGIVVLCADNRVAYVKRPSSPDVEPVVVYTLLRKTVKNREDEEQSRLFKADVEVVRKTTGTTPRCMMAVSNKKYILAHACGDCIYVLSSPSSVPTPAPEHDDAVGVEYDDGGQGAPAPSMLDTETDFMAAAMHTEGVGQDLTEVLVHPTCMPASI